MALDHFSSPPPHLKCQFLFSPYPQSTKLILLLYTEEMLLGQIIRNYSHRPTACTFLQNVSFSAIEWYCYEMPSLLKLYIFIRKLPFMVLNTLWWDSMGSDVLQSLACYGRLQSAKPMKLFWMWLQSDAWKRFIRPKQYIKEVKGWFCHHLLWRYPLKCAPAVSTHNRSAGQTLNF